MSIEPKTTIENGFKKTEIGLIPENWEAKKVGEVGEYINGYAFKPTDWKDTGDPIIRIQNLNDSTKKYNYYQGKLPEKYKIRKGDILISWSASLGTFKWNGPEAWLNQHIFKALPNKQYLTDDYFYWVMYYSISTIALRARGSTMRHVTGKEFRNSLIQIPPLPEQQKITFVLSKIQQAIEQQDKIIQATKELKKSMMNRLFTYGLRGEELKETEIGLMPKSWEVAKLEDICNQKKETIIPEGKGENVYVGLEHMAPGEIFLKSHGFDNEVKSTKFKFDETDVLYGKLRPYLDKAVLPHLSGICSTDIIVLTSNSNTIRNLLVYILHTNNLIEYAKATTSGTNHPRTSWNSLKKYRLALPTLKEQKEIANILSNIDKKIQQAEARKQTLQALFKTMLNNLMTGRVRVKDIDFGDYAEER